MHHYWTPHQLLIHFQHSVLLLHFKAYFAQETTLFFLIYWLCSETYDFPTLFKSSIAADTMLDCKVFSCLFGPVYMIMCKVICYLMNSCLFDFTIQIWLVDISYRVGQDFWIQDVIVYVVFAIQMF